MKKNYLSILMVGALFVSGCTNADYDLSDIDTTARFNVNGLVVPMNIDNVTLKSVLDLKETSKVKETPSGYAIQEDGTFESDAIKVPSFSTSVPQIDPIEASINIHVANGVKATEPASVPIAYYELPTKSTSFTISTDKVPEQVMDIYDVKVDAKAKCNIQISGLSDVLKKVRFNGIQLQLLKGFHLSYLEINGKSKDESETDYLSSYNPQTGILDLSSEEIETENGHINISISISSINADEAGLEFSNPHFSISCECKLLEGGKVSVCKEDFKKISEINSLPTSIGYKCNFDVSEVDVKSFSGKIKYDVTGLNIAPVNLNDLPDLLSQPETDVRITNPQIYIKLNNPLIQEGYSLSAQTGFTLTANRPDEAPQNYSLDEGELVVADDADNSFVLSPIDPEASVKADLDRTDAQHIGFKSLSDICSGKGLPKSISVTADDPQIPEQEVYDFRLGETFNPVKGNYLFFAPLNLKPGTFISYADSIDGWNDEDVDGITIEKLSLDMNVTTDVSLDMNLTVYPIVIRNGKPVIDYSIAGKAHIPASASSSPVTAILEGTITHLDGVYISATLESKQAGKTLSPDMHINLSGLKATVTGYYDKEL